MEEVTDVSTGDATPEGAGAPADNATTVQTKAPRADLTVRALRRWLIALTAVGVLLLVVVSAYAGFTTYKDYFEDGESDPGPDATLIQPIKDGLTTIYGADLASVEVYQVALSYPDSIPDRPYAVTYKLRNSPVTITGMVEGPSTLDESGLVPTMGPLDNQLSAEEMANMLRAFGAHSSKPMGFVYSYSSDLTDGYWEDGDTITVDGKDYAVDDLWCANEGWVPTSGVAVSWSSVPDARAFVFRLNHKTGEFTYVGSEPAPAPLYQGADDGGC